MKPIDPRELSPLFFAINHYFATGDHIGEGVAAETDSGDVYVYMAVRPRELEDAEGFERFAARIDQLRHQGKTLVQLKAEGRQGEFEFHSMTLPRWHVPELAALLTEAPGPLGWGALKGFIDRNGPWEPPR